MLRNVMSGKWSVKEWIEILARSQPARGRALENKSQKEQVTSLSQPGHGKV